MGVCLPLGEGHGWVEEEGDGGGAFGDDVEKETWVDHCFLGSLLRVLTV